MTPRLELDHVCVRFGGVNAVHNLSLSIAPGEIRGLIGPNGAGKTSVINAITGAVRTRSGTVRLDGQDITHLPSHQISRRGIGRTFQHVEAFSEMSVLDNVLVGIGRATQAWTLQYAFATAHARRSEGDLRRIAHATLEAFGLLNVQHARAGDLPFGLLKKMDLARSLAAAPILLLMDEPTSGMSESEADEAIAVARELASSRRITLLVVEHNMRVMMALAERITVVQFGAVVAEGSPQEIQSNPVVIDAYLGQEVDDAVG